MVTIPASTKHYFDVQMKRKRKKKKEKRTKQYKRIGLDKANCVILFICMLN